MVLGCRVRLQKTTHVDRQVAGSLSARGSDDVASLVNTSEDMHGGHACGNSTHNVGLETITDGDRVLRTDELAGAAVDTRLRLAASGRALARRVLDGAD